jgi:tetratricopeptide (TPR) repeat protein
MTTSVALYENGTISYEPTEVSYRTIAYYYGAVEKLETGLRGDTIPTSNRTPTTSNIKIATGDSGVAESIGPSKVPASSPVIDNQTKNVPKESSAPGGTDRQNKQVADGLTLPSVSKITAAVPNVAAAANEKSSVKPRAEEEPRSAVNTSERSEKTPERVISTAPSGERKEIKTSKRDESSSTTALYRAGLKYLATDDYDQAVDTLNQVIRLNPNDGMAYAKLGFAYFGLRKYKEAIVGLNMAIGIKPNVVNADGYYRLGYSYSELGKHKDAIEALKKALYASREEAIDSDQAKSPGVPTWQIYYSLGLAYDNLGRYQDAIRELSEAVKQNPQLAEGYYLLGLAYLSRGDRSSAQKQQRILGSLNAALAKKLGEDITASSFRQSLPCAGSIYFCR